MEETTTMTFANITTTFQPHTVKLAVRVNSWPFQSLTHSLHVVLSDNAKIDENDDDVNACVNEDTDESGSLRWLMVVINDIALYQF